MTPHQLIPHDDLLADCAAEARRIAQQHCAVYGVTGESCSWYHGFWPYLRALGIVTTPTTHHAFYRKTLGNLAARADFSRVLISGSADFNMLEQVFDAFNDEDRETEIVFVDRCPTPVALANWYAGRVGRRVDARSSDILSFNSSPFDVICTHSFLGYFSEDERHVLARKWASLLRPGGKVVTINRVRPGRTAPLGFTPEQVDVFVETARNAAQACPILLDLDPDEIIHLARRYAKCFRIRPVSSGEDLRDLFEKNGFSVDQLDGRIVSGHESRKGTGPTTPDGAMYMHLVATRL